MTYRPGARDEAILVASSDAPDTQKRLADPYICDGTADQTTINQAISASNLTSSPTNRYGAVILTAGRFSLTGAILLPSRGFAIRGQGYQTQLYAAVGSATFDTTGEGTELACIQIDATAAARNSNELSISDLAINCSAVSGISGIWIDQTSGGSNGSGSEGTYGDPTTGTNGDTYHSFRHIRMRGVKYGIGFIGGANTSTRGNNVYDVSVSEVAADAFILSSASDCHLNRCHADNSTAASAVGFRCGGGNTRLTKCGVTDFDHSGAVGYLVSSSRVSIGASWSRNCMTGIDVNSSDTRITGFTATTSTAGMLTAVDLQGATRTNAQGVTIYRTGSGTYTNGLYLPTGGGGHRVDAYINPTGITNPARAGGDTSLVIGDIPTGMFTIEIVGGATLVTTS